jgi:hypothetical protein
MVRTRHRSSSGTARPATTSTKPTPVSHPPAANDRDPFRRATGSDASNAVSNSMSTPTSTAHSVNTATGGNAHDSSTGRRSTAASSTTAAITPITTAITRSSRLNPCEPLPRRGSEIVNNGNGNATTAATSPAAVSTNAARKYVLTPTSPDSDGIIRTSMPYDSRGMSIAARYADFAAREARGVSPTYERLAHAVSSDLSLLALLRTLPPAKQQPNLLFGVVRLLGGPVDDPVAFHDYVLSGWPAVEAELRARSTQTNEAGRCALLLPVLAGLPQPLALLEVGASAGLCLYPDRYTYRYGDHTIGSHGPVLDCAGVRTPPPRLPEVTWRAGLDLNPLDVGDPADVAWLDALIWPEHDHRRARLRAAIAVAAASPPRLLRGDLVDDLPALAAQAPPDATLVVFHTSVLYQVPAERRGRFTDLVRALPGHWIAVESPEVLAYDGLPPQPEDFHNVLALHGVPMAWTRAHGQAMAWFT